MLLAVAKIGFFRVELIVSISLKSYSKNIAEGYLHETVADLKRILKGPLSNNVMCSVAT